MVATVQRRSGARGTRRGRHRPMGDINVTPMVDVMLVLLIIFMVAAPLLTTGVPLELPQTAADPLPHQQEEPLTVQLAPDGKVYLMNAEVPADELLTRLTAIARERKDDQVYLRADQSLSYGAIMSVMGALNRGGFSSIALVTDSAPRAQPAGEAPKE
ncbi:protein TolR [Albimonas sp. CAU 1670]|uniref:protein TolR n=1 Tax=Albimonas sp. CAU 1670 TaxID=3032599 RepID=UPI0023DC5D95|nr:protein TolR [Albimonas sp. CAU 1670]MDF2233560.1 protein TolR [Albimonas sp. CAU 1670]